MKVSGDDGVDGDDFVRSSEFEVATCWMHGLLPLEPMPEVVGSPRAVLEDVITAMAGGTCFVAFSGGRDSSAILAVATLVARRHGLPDPVPVTKVFPGIPAADESEWQQAVIEHLGLREWCRVTALADADFLGPAARQSIGRHGLLWPPAIHSQRPLFLAAEGGTLLTGEGGDEILGQRRCTPVATLLRSLKPKRTVRLDLVAPALNALAPRPVRGRRARRGMAHDLQGWLRPEVRARHLRLLAEELTAEPFRWDRALWSLTRRRAPVVLDHNVGLLARDYNVSFASPLLDKRFLAAVARDGGRWGFRSRTSMMRRYFGDLLPEPVVRRASKASFNRAHFGPAATEFARSWDGTGVPEALVDPEALKREWLSEAPAGISGLLLQQAWLAQQPEHAMAGS